MVFNCPRAILFGLGGKEMKKLWLAVLATTLLVAFVVPAFAWEFSMTGEYEFRYRYFGRADGSKDLFGDMNFQDNILNTTGYVIGFAGPNFYRGYNGGTLAAPVAMTTAYDGSQIRIVRGGFSLAGSDAYANDQRMTFVPSLKVNNAVRLHGAFDLAAIRQRYNHRDFQTNGPLDRWYQDRLSANGTDTAMIPSFSQWRLTTQLPWGVLSIGAKDFPFGTGSLLGYNTRASALLFVLPYGPFRILPSIWLARNPDGFGAFAPYGAGTGPAANSVVNYDGGRHHQIQWSTVFTYENGPINAGGGFVHQITHTDAAGASGVPGVAPVRTTFINAADGAGTLWYARGNDLNVLLWNMFMKYNNGRFFANAEYNFVDQNVNYLGAGGAYNGAPPQYIEAQQAFLELGALCGPGKIAGLFAWSGGQVLNNFNATKIYNGLAINNQATDAYNYLMFHTYGGGNDAPWQSGASFTRDENGMMADAYALAARLDYAVAANLNLWGSYMWAHRVEQNGWLAGSKSSDGTATVGTGGITGVYTAVDAQTWKAAAIPGAGANANPYVDDGYLGWEANLGVDWKLLENFRVNSRYAYWQPGPWFDQAYRVIGFLPGGAASNNAFLQGRSAIQAFECSVLVDF